MATNNLTMLDIAKIYQQQPEDYAVDFGNRHLKNGAYLADLIGRKRLKAICSHSEVKVDFSQLVSGVNAIKKKDLRKIFLLLLDGMCPSLDRAKDLAENSIYAASTKTELELLFLDQVPNEKDFLVDKAALSGKGINGIAERAYLLGLHHLSLGQRAFHKPDRERDLLHDAEMLTSRLADREMQKGMLVHLSEGYFEVDDVFIGGGAYISLLKNINNPSEVKLVCRGTALRKGATQGFASGINDILLEIGSLGIKKVWPQINAYLSSHPEVEHVDILGKSLGGAHAQQLAVLVEGLTSKNLRSLTTCGAVGVSKSINRLFNQVIQKRSTPLTISILRNAADRERDSDYVPSVGGVHLGDNAAKANTKIFYLGENKDLEFFSGKLSFFKALGAFLRSFGIAHCRQITLKNFHWVAIEDTDDDFHSHLTMGGLLERVRRFVAHLLNICTLGVLNGKSFESFYKEQIGQL